MSEQVDDGGPAFPTAEVQRTRNIEGGFTVAFKDGAQGMSLRDWFAGQALAGLAGVLLTDPNAITTSARLHKEPASGFLASTAYQMADAMLAARGGR